MRLLLIFLVLAMITTASAADGLVTRHSREAGFVVRVPADWRYRNASYPSDHSTELWTSPADPASRLKVEVSGCVGCVEPRSCILEHKGCRPAPENIVPTRVVSKQKLDRWRVRYVAKTKAGGYLERGLVSIVHQGSDIRGFALARVWVPAAKARLGDAILASFRL